MFCRAASSRYQREVTLEAYAHQDLPFDYVLNALRLKQSLSRPPLDPAEAKRVGRPNRLESHRVRPSLPAASNC
jgi:non-ribosomal peptide synthetase component F